MLSCLAVLIVFRCCCFSQFPDIFGVMLCCSSSVLLHCCSAYSSLLLSAVFVVDVSSLLLTVSGFESVLNVARYLLDREIDIFPPVLVL